MIAIFKVFLNTERFLACKTHCNIDRIMTEARGAAYKILKGAGGPKGSDGQNGFFDCF